jgi:tRNA-binding EMAP/Myf-like protein
MSTLKVPVVKIKTVEKHPNADRLDLVTLDGMSWVVVTGREDPETPKYKPGDVCIYLPEDSVLPRKLEEFLFPEGSKINLKKSRIRIEKIRKCYSQGMVIDFSPELLDLYPEIRKAKIGEDLIKTLGITKFEPPAESLPSHMRGKTKKSPNPLFRKYTDIENIKNFDRIFQDGELVYCSEKLHGCLTARSQITAADGKKYYIKEIVDNKLDIQLLGMTSEGDLIPTKILNYFKNGSTRDWVKIKFTSNGIRNTNPESIINCTPNHLIYTLEKGYIKAEELKIGDSLVTHSRNVLPSYTQEQILIGKMLGDGCLIKNGAIEFGHKKEHEEYLNYTVMGLGSLGYRKEKEYISGYGTTMVRGASRACGYIGDIFNNWFKEGRKEVPEDINQKLGPISLAFWYMDDGSLGHNESQEDRANFATCNFSEDSIDNLCRAFKNYGIEATKYKSGAYWRIRLNYQEAKKFYTLVCPYIPECMQYKLPKAFRGYFRGFPSLDSERCKIKTINTVIGIESIIELNIKYDLETETHNFFVNQTLVHNSAQRQGLLPVSASTIWKKILKFFRLLPSYEFVVGSRNIQLQDQIVYKGYYKEDIYTKTFKALGMDKILAKDEVLYGEVVSSSVQKGFHYGTKEGEIKFYAYDVMKDGQWLDPSEFLRWCMLKGIDHVPVLDKNGNRIKDLTPENVEEKILQPFSMDQVNKIKRGASTLGNQPIREGVVVKPAKERNSPTIGRVILKAINEDYLLKSKENEDSTDFH